MCVRARAAGTVVLLEGTGKWDLMQSEQKTVAEDEITRGR